MDPTKESSVGESEAGNRHREDSRSEHHHEGHCRETLCRRNGGSTEALVPDESKRLRKNIIRK